LEYISDNVTYTESVLKYWVFHKNKIIIIIIIIIITVTIRVQFFVFYYYVLIQVPCGQL